MSLKIQTSYDAVDFAWDAIGHFTQEQDELNLLTMKSDLATATRAVHAIECSVKIVAFATYLRYVVPSRIDDGESSVMSKEDLDLLWMMVTDRIDSKLLWDQASLPVRHQHDHQPSPN